MGVMVLQIAAPAPRGTAEDFTVAPRRPRMPVPALVPIYAAVLARPIFAPNRRAGDPGGGGAPQGLQLIGVASSGRGGGSAILRAPEGTTHVVGRGESLRGLRLVAVGADRAVFVGPDGPMRLMLGAAAAGPAASSAGVVASVAR